METLDLIRAVFEAKESEEDPKGVLNDPYTHFRLFHFEEGDFDVSKKKGDLNKDPWKNYIWNKCPSEDDMKENMIVTYLELLPNGMSKKDRKAREKFWKDKLDSTNTEYGLNTKQDCNAYQS